MILESGRVVETSDGVTCVRYQPGGNCARCAAGRGCGAALFSVNRESSSLLKVQGCDFAVGDQVLIGMTESTLVSAALLAYGLPLAGLLLGGALGQFAGGDPGAVVAALLGCAVGTAASRLIAKYYLADWQPKLLRQ